MQNSNNGNNKNPTITIIAHIPGQNDHIPSSPQVARQNIIPADFTPDAISQLKSSIPTAESIENNINKILELKQFPSKDHVDKKILESESKILDNATLKIRLEGIENQVKSRIIEELKNYIPKDYWVFKFIGWMFLNL